MNAARNSIYGAWVLYNGSIIDTRLAGHKQFASAGFLIKSIKKIIFMWRNDL